MLSGFGLAHRAPRFVAALREQRRAAGAILLALCATLGLLLTLGLSLEAEF